MQYEAPEGGVSREAHRLERPVHLVDLRLDARPLAVSFVLRKRASPCSSARKKMTGIPDNLLRDVSKTTWSRAQVVTPGARAWA